MKKQILLLCLALTSLCSYAQTITVKGVVTSASDKEPMIGATVQVKGTGTGTITSIDGDYSLNDVAKDAVLVFSSIGYETQEIKVNGQTVINVVLKDASELLDEVVVIGYGAVKKSDLTSSISTVKGKEITETVTGNAMDALQGKINGVQVTSGGGPGAQPKVLIRGVTTVNGTDPLYVVDGMPVGTNINFLNSNDIESMEVLKDASAAAIYGTRASNGVILITTKKGMAGKTNISFNASAGFQTLSKPKMANAAEYKEVFNTRYTNDGGTSIWNDTGATTNPGGTDWWDEVINKTALVQNYSLNISGGSDKLVYNLSMGYYRNNSQYDYGYWDKINARLNTEYTFNKYVKMGFDIAPRVESWDDTPDLFSAAMSMDPTTPIFKPEDQWVDNEFNNYQRSYNNQEWNPAGSLARQNSHSREMGTIVNTYLQINPIQKLTLRTQFGANAHFRRTDKFTPEFYIDALEQSTLSNVSREMQEWLDWNWTNTATYITTFAEKHNINVMGGFTAERFAEFQSKASRDDVPNNMDQMQEVNAGTQNQKSEGKTAYSTLVSYLGRVMYNYDNRYYLTASIRADGSSRFPKGNKYAIFPSVSASWRIISESFMQDQKIFSNLKLRGGWGRVGNQNIDNDATLTLLGQSDYVFGTAPGRVSGTMVSGVGNNLLKWETVEDWNVGVDMSFLDSRLDMTFEYFQKKSSDMLYQKQNIFAIGYPDWNSTVWMNIGSMKASGWELSLNWHDKVADFRYNVGLNLSAVKNKAVKFSGDGPIQTGGFNSDQIIRNEDGGLISRFYGYVADGIFQNWEEVNSHAFQSTETSPGDIRFKDLNNDGKINEDDRTVIGNGFPTLSYGLNLTASYKNFDFSMNMYGVAGMDIYSYSAARLTSMYGPDGGYQNVLAEYVKNAWTLENPNGKYPRITKGDHNKNHRASDAFIKKGDYLKISNIQVGYTFPKNLIKHAKMENARVFVSADNILTLSSYNKWGDPEVGSNRVLLTGFDGGRYPFPLSISFGASVQF